MKTLILLQAFADLPQREEAPFPWLILWGFSTFSFLAGYMICARLTAARMRAMLDTYDPLPVLPVDDCPAPVPHTHKIQPRLPRERRTVSARSHPSEF